MPSGFATLLSTALRAAAASSRIRPPRKLSSLEMAEHEVAVGDGRHRRRRANSRPGPASRRRFRGPTLSTPKRSTLAMVPPPALTVLMSIIGTARSRPSILPRLAIERLAVLDQRHVAGGAAHVEGDDVLEAGHAAGIGAGGDAAGRAGQHGGDGLARGGGEGRHAAVRLHDVFLPRGRGRRSLRRRSSCAM